MKRFLPPILALVLLAGCAGPRFIPIRPIRVAHGTGGTPDVIHDVQYYQFGTPARPYTILGYLDHWWVGPFLDDYDMQLLAPDIKRAGANAAVVVRGDGPLPGLRREPNERGPLVLRVQLIK
jgi:hypothetical protein